MEHTLLQTLIDEDFELSTSKPFIIANTIETSIEVIKNKHIIPVYAKDNETLISHTDFINTVQDLVYQQYQHENILEPSIRISHPVKGRIPSAKNKAVKELNEHEETLYYERMMFCIEVPSIYDIVDGQKLSLTIGGVKSYSLDNLSSRKGNDEHFKLFIGYKNKVCTNLCVWSDGYSGDLKVKSLEELTNGLLRIFQGYDLKNHVDIMTMLTNYSLTEQQFANLVGRAKLYPYLSAANKKTIPRLEFGDTHFSVIAKDYYQDKSFCRDEEGNISLWKLYNLFTNSNKGSYIDYFLDRSVNAHDFSINIMQALEGRQHNWFLT